MKKILSSIKKSIFNAALIASTALLLLRYFGAIRCSLMLAMSPALAVIGLTMVTSMIAGYAGLSIWRRIGDEAKLEIIDIAERENKLYYDKLSKKA